MRRTTSVHEERHRPAGSVGEQVGVVVCANDNAKSGREAFQLPQRSPVLASAMTTFPRAARTVTLMASVAVLIGCPTMPTPSRYPAPSRIGGVDRERLLEDRNPGDWLTLGRDFRQSYYSPLDLIDRENVSELGFAWQVEIENISGLQATPIVVDGMMFTSGPHGAAYAVDARTGRLVWSFKPEIDVSQLGKVCCGQVNRGVAVWESRVFVASIDGHLYALDAATGEELWRVDTITERSRGYTITGAPYIAGDGVVIGNSGADFDARGYFTAYDTETGRQRWRFFTVPGDPANGVEHPELATALETWDPDSLWEVGLGGTVWDGMAYDPELDLLYVGTGNSTPYPRKLRSPSGGDNLFLSCILAIDPKDGRLVWHYQTTPRENWDYTAAQKLVLADIDIRGRHRKVIMQAPKNGFFYVLDRESGELISAEPIATINWASRVDSTTGRPVETGQGEYFEEPKLIFPSPLGAHNWQPMAFNPDTGLVYLPTTEAAAIYALPEEEFVYQRGARNGGVVLVMAVNGPTGFDGPLMEGMPPIERLAEGQPDYTSRGFLRAWNPATHELAWEVETSGDWAGELYAANNGGGAMTSAGDLVFQGRMTGELVAYDAKTGRELHRVATGTSIQAAPIAYSIDGVQYVAVMAGMGNYFAPELAMRVDGSAGRIISFKLGGGSVPRPKELSAEEQRRLAERRIQTEPALPRRGTKTQYKKGAALYRRLCGSCHNNNAPDLRRMTGETHAEFRDIVLEGVRAEKGMGRFDHVLSGDDAEALQVYVIDLAWQAFEKQSDAARAPH